MGLLEILKGICNWDFDYYFMAIFKAKNLNLILRNCKYLNLLSSLWENCMAYKLGQ